MARWIHCERCGRNKQHHAKGLCGSCYMYLRYHQNHCLDCGVEIWYRAIRCCDCAAKLRACDPEIRCKIADGVRRAWVRGDFDNRDPVQYHDKLSKAIRAAWKRGAYGEEWKRNMAEGREIWDNEDYRAKVSEGVKQAWERGDFRGVRQSAAWRQQISEKLRKRWQDNEYRQNQIEAMRAAHARGCFKSHIQSPTQPERIVMAVLELLGIEYDFNEFILESYVYDFYLPALNILIEYDGWYWHQQEDQKRRDIIKDDLADEAGHRLIRLRGMPDHDLTGPEIWVILIQELRNYGCFDNA